LKEGCIVYAADRKMEPLVAAWAQFDRNALSHATSKLELIEMDVTDEAQVKQMAKIVQASGSGLFGVVNGAGIGQAPGYPIDRIQGVVELNVDQWIKPVIDVNLLGTMRVNQAFFPLILESKGCFLNIASIMGHMSPAGFGAYTISKKAIVGYSDTMRRELSPYGIRVGCLAPGFIATPMVLPIFHPEAVLAPRDYNHTSLHLGRGDEGQWPMIAGTYEQLPTPKLVSESVHWHLFHDVIPPHSFIDNPSSKLFHIIMSFLPYRWSDAILDRLRHRNIDSYKVYGPKS
jgi:NAD(P)-dependent dehydrogenase (short-subunit alcohol dehydrogenase family)